MRKSGGCVSGDALHGFERNHFTGDFRKALYSAADVNKVVGIDRNDVSGGVPTFIDRLWRVNETEFIVEKLPFHDVGAFDVQRTAIFYSGYVLEDVLDSRQQLSDAANAACHGYVDGDDRCTFGDPIVLKDSDAEFLEPKNAHVLRQL